MTTADQGNGFTFTDISRFMAADISTSGESSTRSVAWLSCSSAVGLETSQVPALSGQSRKSGLVERAILVGVLKRWRFREKNGWQVLAKRQNIARRYAAGTLEAKHGCLKPALHLNAPRSETIEIGAQQIQFQRRRVTFRDSCLHELCCLVLDCIELRRYLEFSQGGHGPGE
jgi:hypothetical protein